MIRTTILIAFFIVVLTVATGCRQTTSEQWSSKRQSVLGMSEADLGDVQADPPALAQAAEPGVAQQPAGEQQSPAELRESAVGLLLDAARSSNALLRANAIEALQNAPQHLDEVVREALVDTNRGVRFVAAMAIGREQLTGIAHLLEPLLHDSSKSVQAAAMYGLQRTGQEVDLSPLADFALSSDAEVRGNAIFILGELGNPSAAPVIESSLGRGMSLMNESRARLIDLQAAEALTKLGFQDQIEPIRATLLAPSEHSELIALACEMTGRLGDDRYRTVLARLVEESGRGQRPPEVRLAAVAALAELGYRPAISYEVAGHFTRVEDSQTRAQAAVTLGELGGERAAAVLSGLLRDRNPLVQVAAAKGLLAAMS